MRHLSDIRWLESNSFQCHSGKWQWLMFSFTLRRSSLCNIQHTVTKHLSWEGFKIAGAVQVHADAQLHLAALLTL